MVTIIKTISLALVDAINPCALAVMVLVLMTLLLRDPTKRKKVLYGGLMFTLAVFILYFLYGAIMIQFFSNLIPKTGVYSYYLFKGFGVLSIILGVMNLNDYLNYKPGRIATEMPLTFRPRMRMLVKSITSPWGAFLTGIFVTLFLLPCTIGPYIIFSGDISSTKPDFMTVLPWLFLYNIIFVLPMIAITLGIYFGVTTIDKVSGWEERNIKKLHLAEGIILITLGILMTTGII